MEVRSRGKGYGARTISTTLGRYQGCAIPATFHVAITCALRLDLQRRSAWSAGLGPNPPEPRITA